MRADRSEAAQRTTAPRRNAANNFKTGFRKTYFAPDGSTYVGEWKDGKRHGKGRYCYPNHDVYEGQWVNNKPSGFGRFYVATIHQKPKEFGSRFDDSESARITHELRHEGEWLRGLKHGYGVHRYPNGERYEGNFEADQRSGFGTLFYPPPPREPGQPAPPAFGTQYRGGWAADERSGKGALLFPSGDIYFGEFQGNRRHGTGVYFYARTRRKLEGLWVEGVCRTGEYMDWAIADELDVLRLWVDPVSPWPGLEPRVIEYIRRLLDEGADAQGVHLESDDFPFDIAPQPDRVSELLKLPAEPAVRPIPRLAVADNASVVSEAIELALRSAGLLVS
eukprot:gnl/Chilomastix_cuspidata/2590.p1 GENE.gnl/Chilomastix_cuspidata/2590~~gnl/Chilomastix_cuspidata/2590.p1  ORF type:complete len:335 (+),score=102.30 gnl/Chilomastix_cuspidata/2590:1307-2311(+)